MRILRQDFYYAARQLRTRPGFALLVILTVALGIGANTAVFSVLNGFLRPLPVKDPQQIVVIAARTKGDDTGFRYRFSYAALQDFRQRADRFSDLFAFNTIIAGLTADGKTTQFLNSAVTGNCFSALGLQAAAGRLFLPGEGEAPGGESLVVLGYSYWQKRFGGNPGVVGKQVRVDGHASRIVGVAPKEFHGLYGGAEMDGYIPLNTLALLQWTDGGGLFTNRKNRAFTVLGRMKPGVSLTQAQSSMDVLARHLEQQYPATDKGIGVRVVPETLTRPIPLRFLADAVPTIRGFLLILAGLVLSLACMNVANILLVRASMRQREMAIRAALGSGRARLVRQMLTESALLALLGAAAGLVFGKWASDAFGASIHLATDFPVILDFSFDWRVFAYALTAAVLTGILIGVWPAIRVSRTDATAVLHEGRGDSSGSGHPSRQRLRSVLVTAQVAGSLVLLIVAGLFVRSLQRAQHLDLGFDPDHLLNARMDPHQVGYDQPRAREFYRELERRVRALPGVQSVSLAFTVPMGYISDGNIVYVEGRPASADEQPPVVASNYIDGDYFATMRIPLVGGRAFRETDNETGPRVAIVNQTMAARYWPNQDPIGKRFRMGLPDAPFWEVAGVARDSRYLAVFEPSMPYLYVPLAQRPSSLRSLQVRSAAPPEALKLQVQKVVQSLDPDMPVADLQTMKESIEGGAAGFLMFRIGAIQAGAMGILGLILAIVGVYGVVSYGASQRTHEIGIRLALGAQRGDIRRLILRQGVLMVASGVAAGMIGAALLTRLAARFVLIVNATDPLTFVAVALLLSAVALWACYIPARRAMKVDPMVALRHE